MSATLTSLRNLLGGLALASLGACAVVPAQPVPYGARPVYVEPYPVIRYGYPYPYGYYEYDRRYDDRGYREYRDERRHDDRQRYESPIDSAVRAHRDVRRSLGLPRLPGMP